MNRIKRFVEEPPDIPELGDFYTVAGEFGRFAVDRDVARHIKAALDSWRPRRWIVGQRLTLLSRSSLVTTGTAGADPSLRSG